MVSQRGGFDVGPLCGAHQNVTGRDTIRSRQPPEGTGILNCEANRQRFAVRPRRKDLARSLLVLWSTPEETLEGLPAHVFTPHSSMTSSRSIAHWR